MGNVFGIGGTIFLGVKKPIYFTIEIKDQWNSTKSHYISQGWEYGASVGISTAQFYG